jgi:hypothetical protein
MSINDIITQIGACAGLLQALCATVKLVLRYLIYSFGRCLPNQKDIQTGAASRLQKLLRYLDNRLLQCRKKDSDKPETEFEHPRFLIAACFIIGVLFLASCVGGAVLGVFHISTTALTYIIILLNLFISIIALVWIAMAEEDEISVETQLHVSSPIKYILEKTKFEVFKPEINIISGKKY